MLKKTSRIGLILFILIIAASFVFTGCKKGPQLKGSEIKFASWWSDYNVNTYEPRNESEAEELEYRKRALAEKGFEAEYVQIADDYDYYFQTVVSNFMSGNKEYGIYELQADWAMTLYKQGLAFPISDADYKLTNRVPVAGQRAAYNKMMEDMFTFGGKSYAVSIGVGGDAWHGVFLFWNKRLFREAGIDPDLPYDLQKNNQWTWDAFYDLARQLTRDTNNTGVIDQYGLPCDDAREVMDAFVFGNNANWVTINSAGVYQNATNTPEFLEALAFYQRLVDEGLMKLRPENAAWDWDFTEFFDGRTGMFIGPEWRKGQMPEMADDYGCVLPPRGPRSSKLRMPLDEIVYVVPSYFTKEEVNIILEAFDIWQTPMDTDWKAGHWWAFRDRRAVDETVALTKDSQDFVTYKNYTLIPGYPKGDILLDSDTLFWEVGSPSQIVESWAPRIQAALDNANR